VRFCSRARTYLAAPRYVTSPDIRWPSDVLQLVLQLTPPSTLREVPVDLLWRVLQEEQELWGLALRQAFPADDEWRQQRQAAVSSSSAHDGVAPNQEADDDALSRAQHRTSQEQYVRAYVAQETRRLLRASGSRGQIASTTERASDASGDCHGSSIRLPGRLAMFVEELDLGPSVPFTPESASSALALVHELGHKCGISKLVCGGVGTTEDVLGRILDIASTCMLGMRDIALHGTLSVASATALASAMRHWNLTSLNLTDCQLGPAGLKALSACITDQASLHSMRLAGNRLGGQGCTVLIGIFRNAQDEAGNRAACTRLADRLVCLDVSNNQLVEDSLLQLVSHMHTMTVGSPLPHLHRDWAHGCHVGNGTGLTPAHICTGTGLTPCVSVGMTRA
jgi:hypothetical protein